MRWMVTGLLWSLMMASTAWAQADLPLDALSRARVETLQAKTQALQAEAELLLERSGLRARQRTLDEERQKLIQALQEAHKVTIGPAPGNYDLSPDGTRLVPRPDGKTP